MFTDHKTQGQTLENVMVNIGTMKKFPMTPFSAYVALSQSKGQDPIKLLRYFNEAIFTKHPLQDLQLENERLKTLIKNSTDRFDMGYYNF